jgi:hypothetical protein
MPSEEMVPPVPMKATFGFLVLFRGMLRSKGFPRRKIGAVTDLMSSPVIRGRIKEGESCKDELSGMRSV